MFFRRQPAPRSAPVLIFATTRAKPAEEFDSSLADKYNAQVKWMCEKGITGCLSKAELEAARSMPKRVVDP